MRIVAFDLALYTDAAIIIYRVCPMDNLRIPIYRDGKLACVELAVRAKSSTAARVPADERHCGVSQGFSIGRLTFFFANFV
jgi:hypothetical protein